jgi:hypothetical protein
MFSFGYFPGVRLSFADVSELYVRSIFKGWMKFQNTAKIWNLRTSIYVFPLRIALFENKQNKIRYLTPELNPSAQRCLTRFFTGDFVSWTVHLVNICVKNQQIHKLFI